MKLSLIPFDYSYLNFSSFFFFSFLFPSLLSLLYFVESLADTDPAPAESATGQANTGTASTGSTGTPGHTMDQVSEVEDCDFKRNCNVVLHHSMTHLVRISIFLIRECAVSTLQHNNEYVRTSNVFKVSHGFNPASGEGATHSGGSGSGSGRYQETAQNGTYVCSTLFTCIYNVSVSNVSVSVIRNVHFKKRS